jgi:hypothetical protein
MIKALIDWLDSTWGAKMQKKISKSPAPEKNTSLRENQKNDYIVIVKMIKKWSFCIFSDFPFPDSLTQR